MNHINLVACINKLGYGTHGINMLKAFNDIGMTTSLQVKGEIDDNYNKILVNNSLKIPFDPLAPTLHIFHDEFLEKYPGKYIIPFTIFETTIVRKESLDKIEKYGEIVFTTTVEHKNILKNNGIIKPIYVINEGVNPKLYNTENCKKIIDTKNYTFLLLGKYEKRKNIDLVMTAFIEEMQYKNVTLILHTFNPFIQTKNGFEHWYKINPVLLGYKFIEETEQYVHFSNSYSDIYYTKPILECYEMKSLYHSADVGISCSSAEGWGLPEMEMMACGKPVIISNVIGHKEYIKNLPVFKELVIEPIDTEIANDGKYFLGDRGEWSKLDIIDIINKMEYSFNNKIGTELSQELSDYIINNYNWIKIAIQIKQIINRVEDEK